MWYCETSFQEKSTYIIFLTYNLDIPEDVDIQIQKERLHATNMPL